MYICILILFKGVENIEPTYLLVKGAKVDIFLAPSPNSLFRVYYLTTIKVKINNYLYGNIPYIYFIIIRII